MNLKWVPYIVIFVFSLVVASIRAMILDEWSIWQHLIAYGVQLVFLIAMWHVMLLINAFWERRLPFRENALRRMVVQILSTILLFSPIYPLAIYLGKSWMPDFANKQFLGIGGVLLLVMLILLNFGFYMMYFFNAWKESLEEQKKLEVARFRLEKENSEMRYHHLHNQVNPHFLFNTLSSLDGLVQSDPELASRFIRHLAKVYRYVLEHKSQEVVNLYTELEFIQHYLSLLKIRYGEALQIDIQVSDVAREKGIVMVTLQMLLDNAIKHNSLQASQPLHIRITERDQYLLISNNRQIRRQMVASNKKGLKQLKDLYAFHTDIPVKVEETEDMFCIQIPLL